MKIDAPFPRHLTYCMNVHPGESWDDTIAAIRNHVVPLRERLAPGKPFGLGLRLSHAATQTATPEAVAAMRALFDRHDLYLVTINAFPYGAFHGERVKENVYRPDWRTRERRDYTMRIADIAAGLAAPGETISISTVPGSYGPWIRSDGDVAAMVERFMEVVAHLAEIEQREGCRLILGLEPEPDCFLQTTDDTLAFFAGPINTIGRPCLGGLMKDAGTPPESLIARHLGVCFDTCHLALQFERLEQSLYALADAGICIAKVQLSSALHTRNTDAANRALRAFCDPVYLHQVRTCAPGDRTCRRYPDLEVALAAATAGTDDEAWRVHFHVPLYFETYGPLGSTSRALSPAFFKTLEQLHVSHLEIETYTFDVLPPDLRALGIGSSLVREYEWVLDQLQVQGCSRG